MSIVVKDLTKIFGSQRAVDGISFSAQPGQIVGFLGPNGAGKSTTMKMLSGYSRPSMGTASIAGKDIVEQSLEARARVGYLPEHNPLYLELYVREYLRFIGGVAKYKGNIKTRVEELIQLTGLTTEAHKKIGALSKGYRQRVGLAHAILHDPEVLILDEPTSGLDPNQIVEIRNLIQKLGENKTVLLSTHLMQEVQAICSRVIIIHKGKLVADGPTSTLTQGEGYQLTIELDKPTDTKVWMGKIAGLQSVEVLKGNRYVLHSEGDIRAALFAQIVGEGRVLLGMQQYQQNIEAIFRQLTSSGKEEGLRKEVDAEAKKQ